MDSLMTTLSNILWSMPLVVIILGVSVYFSIRMKFPQFRYLKEMIHIISSGGESQEGLSPIKAFILTAARTVGVGNIAGMATALYFGGPGAIFWLWILALVGAGIALIEAVLAQTFREKINGEFRGGPPYYMRGGMKNKSLGRVFAVIYAATSFICMTFLLPGAQSYNVAHGLSDAFGIPVIVVGVLFTLLIAFAVLGGLKRIGNVAHKVSPIMAILYVIMSLVIIVVNIQKLPSVLALIVKSAFGTEQVFAAVVGTAVSTGIKRGVFANEVGLGTSAVTGAVGDVSHPVKQGLTNAMSVFIGTFFVCTPSAIMMLMTGCYNVVGSDGNLVFEGLPGVAYGNGFVSTAIDTVIPGLGAPFVALALLCFAFVALLAYYLYAESNLLYLIKNKTVVLAIRICFIISVFVGTVVSADLVWAMGDVGNGLFAWINVVALILLSGLGIRIFNSYDQQRKNGVSEPVFNPTEFGFKDECATWLEQGDKTKVGQKHVS
jgi:AGCS family alanine or glycine:cation symporter